TWGAQMAIFLLLSPKSFNPVIRPGFPLGTAIWRTLETKFVGSSAAPTSVTVLIVAGLAAAKTSIGAPSSIWVASVALEPKLKITVVPGFVASNCLPMSVKASVNDAAAATVIVSDG